MKRKLSNDEANEAPESKRVCEDPDSESEDEKESKKYKVETESDLEKIPDGIEVLDVNIQLSTDDLLSICSKVGKTLTSLEIHPEYNDENSKTMDVGDSRLKFPKLERMDCKFQEIFALNFKKECFPQLSRVSIEQPCAQNLAFADFDLPELKHLSFEHVTFDETSKFGKSCSKSKKLENIMANKLWGLGCGNQCFRCPALETFDVYRSDDIESISIHSKNLNEINLQACYSIRKVNIYPDSGIEYRVNLLNCCDVPSGNLTTNSRCGEIFGKPGGSDEDADPMGWMF